MYERTQAFLFYQHVKFILHNNETLMILDIKIGLFSNIYVINFVLGLNIIAVFLGS